MVAWHSADSRRLASRSAMLRTASGLPSALRLTAVAWLAVPVALAAQPDAAPPYAPSRVAWSELGYVGSKLGVRAESEVHFEMLPAAACRSRLVEPSDAETDGRRAVALAGERVASVVIDTSLRGTRTVSELLLNPANAAAYQRAQVSTSRKRSFRRVYRYLTDGVFVRRQMPEDPTGEPLDWPVSNSRVIDFPDGVGDGDAVTEAMAIFYMLSAADFHRVGDSLRFTNFDRDGMTEMVMTVENLEPWKVDYEEVSAAGTRRVRETRTVAHLILSGSALGGDGEYEFLGLRGEIEILADTELRVPVAVKGRVPIVGRTTVEVDRVVLR